MKTASAELQAHFGLDCTTLAVLWKLTRADGPVLGFTTHDRNIEFDDGSYSPSVAVLYEAATGFTHTANESKSDLSVDNLEVTGFLDSDSIDEADVRAELYDEAAVEQRIVNWDDLTQGAVLIRSGTVGNIRLVNGVFVAEVRGLTQKLSTVIGSTYGPICRAELGSQAATPPARRPWVCGVVLADYIQSGSVSSSPTARTLVPASGLIEMPAASPAVDAPEGWFDNGIITFTSGALDGRSFEIKSWALAGSPPVMTLELFLPLPEQPADGSNPSIPADTFTIEPGCDHTTTDCKTKFDNIVNFRGEPFIPGNDLVLQYPDSKA